jgi:hypothetical protein
MPCYPEPIDVEPVAVRTAEGSGPVLRVTVGHDAASRAASVAGWPGSPERTGRTSAALPGSGRPRRQTRQVRPAR